MPHRGWPLFALCGVGLCRQLKRCQCAMGRGMICPLAECAKGAGTAALAKDGRRVEGWLQCIPHKGFYGCLLPEGMIVLQPPVPFMISCKISLGMSADTRWPYPVFSQLHRSKNILPMKLERGSS